MIYYMNVGPQYMEPIARQLYQEIGLIEQEHVTHYESLVDPGETWWERLVTHEYNECWLYYSFLSQETDPRIKAIWELHLQMELAHLQQAGDLMRRHDGREPEEIVGDTGLPEPLRFEPNKEYLRHLLATQIDLTKLGAGYVREAHERFEQMQQQLHGDQKPPSEQVIDSTGTCSATSTGWRPRARTRSSRCAPPRGPAVPEPKTADTAVPDGRDVDVVDLLLTQHARIEEQFLLVDGRTGEAKQRDASTIWSGCWRCTRPPKRRSSTRWPGLRRRRRRRDRRPARRRNARPRRCWSR